MTFECSATIASMMSLPRGPVIRAVAVAVVAAGAAVACAPANEAQRPRPSPTSIVSPGPAGASAGAVDGRSCGSDLVCPLGFVCAKKAGAFTGDCLRSVDENGAPVEVRHSVDSYGAGANTCVTTSDCPTGFRCDDGRCIR